MTSRRTGGQTRSLLLDVGVALLLERGVSAGVAHVRLQDVLRRAGLTTGAAYRLWQDQDDFHRDLACELARRRFLSPTEVARAAVTDGEPLPLQEVVRRGAASHVESLAGRAGGESAGDRGLFLAVLALRASTADQPHWSEFRQACRDRHGESIEEFITFYGELMAAHGRRLRSPLNIEQFAQAMAALGEGFALHQMEGIDHEPIHLAKGEEWTLFGICVSALVDRFFEAAP